jgi:hypothetical protein
MLKELEPVGPLSLLAGPSSLIESDELRDRLRELDVNTIAQALK